MPYGQPLFFYQPTLKQGSAFHSTCFKITHPTKQLWLIVTELEISKGMYIGAYTSSSTI